MPVLYLVFPWRYRPGGVGENKSRMEVSPNAVICQTYEGAVETASALYREGTEELLLVLKFPAYGKPGLMCLIGMLSAELAQNRWKLAEHLECVEKLAYGWIEHHEEDVEKAEVPY